MKLNLGSGFKRIPDFHNVDANADCRPDTLWNLEKTPWPFETNSVEEFWIEHALEHLGQSTESWFAIWQELYRVSKDGAMMTIIVPHPRHDTFLVDPTHVRPVFPETVALFDQARNQRDIESGGQESILGLQHKIDLEVSDVQYELDARWRDLARENKTPLEEVQRNIHMLNNICQAIKFRVRVIKPARFRV